MNPQEQWLSCQWEESFLREDHEDYLLGRGGSDESINRLGVMSWTPSTTPSPCTSFRKWFGETGTALRGYFVCPLYSPSGRCVGFFSRHAEVKKFFLYLIPPQLKWLPTFIGLTQEDQGYLNNRRVWLVEGIFDYFAMSRIVPEGDIVLACLRASISRLQLQFLVRTKPQQIFVVFDRDEAGLKGSQFAYEYLSRRGLFVQQVSYRGGKDPGEIWDSSGEYGLRKEFRSWI